ncbi:MAG: hypothetical protein CME82_02700 [Halomonas sp.]|nr:hypothetical protein [Halomonas sp.]|tara:strand:- start:221 stop:1222 length:1002 start_codon:yes stop_codon:yes gene_type:complete
MKASARQQGAALLVVLSLVAIASVVAMAGVKSALVDERLAGNMRAMAQAQMAADWGGAERLSETPESSGLSECEVARDKALDGRLIAGWSDVLPVSGSETVGYRYIDCLYQATPLQLIRGQVSDGEQVLAQHFLMVGRESEGDAGLDLPDLVPEECIVVSSGPTWPPIPGVPASCDNFLHGEELKPDGYVAEVAQEFADEPFNPDGCANQGKLVYCAQDQGFEGSMNLASYADADQIVIEYEGQLTLELTDASCDASIATTAAPTVEAHGDVTLNGDLWSSGSLAIYGDAEGSTVVTGTVVSTGGVSTDNITFVPGENAGGGGGGVVWVDRDD